MTVERVVFPLRRCWAASHQRSTANKLHSPGTPLRVLTSAFSEGQSGAGDQVFDGPRYENFGRVGQGRHTGTDVNRIPPSSFPMIMHSPVCKPARTSIPSARTAVGDRARAANGACGPVENREKAIASGDDLAATVTCKFATDERMMIVQQIPPAAVAQASGLLSGSDYVGEQQVASTRSGSGPSSNAVKTPRSRQQWCPRRCPMGRDRCPLTRPVSHRGFVLPCNGSSRCQWIDR